MSMLETLAGILAGKSKPMAAPTKEEQEEARKRMAERAKEQGVGGFKDEAWDTVLKKKQAASKSVGGY